MRRGSHRRCAIADPVNALLHHFGTLSAIEANCVRHCPSAGPGATADGGGENDESHRRLAKQFSSRECTRTYLALVHGCPSRIAHHSKPISRHSQKRTRMTTKASAPRRGHALCRQAQARRPLRQFALVELKIEPDARTRFAFTCRRLGIRWWARALRRAGQLRSQSNKRRSAHAATLALAEISCIAALELTIPERRIAQVSSPYQRNRDLAESLEHDRARGPRQELVSKDRARRGLSFRRRYKCRRL